MVTSGQNKIEKGYIGRECEGQKGTKRVRIGSRSIKKDSKSSKKSKVVEKSQKV